MKPINWTDFEQIDIRVGTIIEALPFPEAKIPAYKLKIDFGKIGILKSSARITDLYKPEELVGKQIVGVVNFPPKQIGPFISECLVTGFINNDKEVVLAVPDKNVENGLKLM